MELSEKLWRLAAGLQKMANFVLQTNLMIWLVEPQYTEEEELNFVVKQLHAEISLFQFESPPSVDKFFFFLFFFFKRLQNCINRSAFLKHALSKDYKRSE